jgi:CheY-like chemotaxis protein
MTATSEKIGDPHSGYRSCQACDGLELVDELRRRGSSIPAILLTCDPNPHVRDRATAARVPVIEKLNSVKSVVECIHAIVKAGVN